jgi:hypothetical protein
VLIALRADQSISTDEDAAMWAIKNRTPYAAESNWVLDKNAEKSWVVVVKGIFDIKPDGTANLSEEQDALPLYSPEYSGEPGKSSLVYEADLLGSKQCTDVILIGSAYAEKGRPATKVDVSLRVNNLIKRLKVFGDRYWKRGILGGLSMTSPKPFKSMPIKYECAYGGWDTRSKNPGEHRLEPRNPIGTGFAVRSKHLVGQPLPNIEYPKQLISSWKNRPNPAGFGPIASYWTPRKEYAGTYDEQWQKERFPLWAKDFDVRFNQCAPLDQQMTGFLHGGQRVELINLSPNGRISFELPKVYPFFVTRFGKERVEHRADLHTVILEPEIPRVIMVWYTSLQCHHRVDELDMTVISEKQYI